MGPVRHIFLLMLLLLGACSMRTTIEAMTSEQDRAFAREMVLRLRAGDRAWLKPRFDPELWTQSASKLDSVPALFPGEAGRTELVGVNISTEIVNGETQRSKQFTLATQAGERWVLTVFQTYSTGGPDRVVQWSVVPHASRPAEVAVFETWNAAIPWVRGGLTVFLFAMGGLVFWLVRRSRRKRGAGRHPGEGRDP